jgi:hypothetical protein
MNLEDDMRRVKEIKLYAAVDRRPDDKHFEDLKKLNPTAEELVFAARR